MITIFSTPKAFEGHIGLIQNNALANWRLFRYETLLYCDDDGVSSAAKRYGATHLPNVQRSGRGTPIISSIFNHAQTIASNDLIMYANTDIIFVRGLSEVVNYINQSFDRVLVIGSRYNLDVRRTIKYSGDWSRRLEMEAREKGVPHPGAGVDYFIFRKGMFNEMPPFSLGRGYWDTWLVGRAIADNDPVVDSTSVIFVIHQNHDYLHLPQGVPHREKRDKWYPKGPETQRNERLRGGINKSCKDATYIMTIDPFTGSLIHV